MENFDTSRWYRGGKGVEHGTAVQEDVANHLNKNPRLVSIFYLTKYDISLFYQISMEVCLRLEH